MNHPPYRLLGFVQHYVWGGFSFIPSFLGLANKERKPYAELWLGTHAKGPSRIVANEHGEFKDQRSGGDWQLAVGGSRESVGNSHFAGNFYRGENITPGTIRLDELIIANPEEMLGEKTIKTFGPTLPFLLKILDARDMLSIQVHPSKEQALAGFSMEQAAGIPVDSPQRNYKDTNHKPEVHVALSDFYMLHGFRPLNEISDLLASVPSFAALAPDLKFFITGLADDDERRPSVLRDLYEHLMRLPQEKVDRAIDPLLRRIQPLYRAGELKKISPHYWAAKAAESHALPGGHHDRGIFSFYLLNLLHLKPGQGTYQAAGVLHAYLQGTTIELMANSDNVLRGGLTPKHIDVSELLKIVDLTAGTPDFITGEARSRHEKIYRTEARDFELSRIELKKNQIYSSRKSHGPEIWIILSGESNCLTHILRQGRCYFIPGDVAYSIKGIKDTVIYKASVPIQ